ncbi:RloB family protein [Rhodoferax sp.]|uniref:RloB family protein n=1 Tax=Rhodoferax sp. TaxID=50421 RepID=UPI00261A34E0|nr:RloB family protein [Rhodoferax sp.]MDD2920260.1 RloB family protein [Rhodoferax sp.]
MGSDDLFKKAKARSAASLVRQRKERSKSPRYLIVCEGTKTEPQYLFEILMAQRIPPQQVKVAPNDGNSPDRVVDHAYKLYEEDARLGDPYDKVFCVFDRDSHQTFEPALQRIHRWAKDRKPFVATTSTPCFEFWLMLHFDYSDAPFHAAGKKSVGDQALAQLKKKPGFAKYGKGIKGVYGLLKDKTSVASTYAKRLRRSAGGGGQINGNPWTNVDELVNLLLNLK